MEYAKLTRGQGATVQSTVQLILNKRKLHQRPTDSTRQNMRSIWRSNKYATVQDLARHTTSLTNLQVGSRLVEGRRSSGKLRDRRDIRRSPEAAVVFLDTDGTSTPLSYCTSNRTKCTPGMMIHYPRHQEGCTSRSSTGHYETVASSVDNIDYCRVRLSCSHRVSTCLLLNIMSHTTPSSVGGMSTQPNFRRETPTTWVTEAQGAVGNSQLDLFVWKSKARGAMVELSRTHTIRVAEARSNIFQSTVVPGTMGETTPSEELAGRTIQQDTNCKM